MDYYDLFLAKIQPLHQAGYFIVLAAAFLESLVLVGGVVPGSTLVVFAGALAAEGQFRLVPLMGAAVAGAILGDALGYWLGLHGTGLFKDYRRYLKPEYLETTHKFFEKHGASSIFFGRFVAVVRMLVPFVAGLSKMEAKQFFLWNVVSGVAWGCSHVLGGYFLGKAWRRFEVWMGWTAVIAVAAALLAGAVWLIRRRLGKPRDKM